MIDIRIREACSSIESYRSIARIEDYLISKQHIFFQRRKKKIAESRRCSTA